MKKIGLRTIKTAISIFICSLIYIILRIIDKSTNSSFHFSYILYSPFFAGIATAYSLYPDKKRSLNQAKNRIVASIIGGLIGIILVVIYELIFGKNSWPLVIDINRNTTEYIIPFILVACFVVLVIEVSIALKQNAVVFVAILTFISITLNPNATLSREIGIWIFGFNRIISTIIGVVVALFVNTFHLPHRIKNKDLLFCLGLDGLLKSDKATIKGFMNYKLNYLCSHGANCTIFTTRTPSTFMQILDDVNINLPIICFSGAALYDCRNNKYIYKELIDNELEIELENYFKSINISPFKNYIIDDLHHVYNDKINNFGEELYKKTRKNLSYISYDEIDSSKKGDLINYLLIEKEEVIKNMKNDLLNGPLKDKISIQIYDYFDSNDDLVPELKYAKIYSKKIEDLNGLKEYANKNNYRIVGVTYSQINNNLLYNSDFKVTSKENKDFLNDLNIINNSKTYDDLFKVMQKMYYSKKYSKKVE